MKYISFRFDVDTHKCIQQGVPNLLKIARKHKVTFTFYVNFGRSIDQLSFVKGKFQKQDNAPHHDNLSAFKKLGLKDYLVAAIFNPQISVVGEKSIRRILKEGHEIGLHGGTNHELWNQMAMKWNTEQLDREIKWGIEALKKIEPKYKMKGFASPHWKGNQRVYKVLKQNNFKYVSDIHTDRPLQEIARPGDRIPNVPVNISGEPGGVGYLEWCRAKGFSDRELLSDFTNKLKKRSKSAIVYDHPYYSGVQELNMIEGMIKVCKREGFKIVPVETLYKKI